jgi:hypothetical protein
MNINRENYEAYYLDFIEGNLDQEKIVELQCFLAQNRDIQLDTDAFEIYLNTLNPDCISFENKDLLKVIDWNQTEITHDTVFNFQLASLDHLLTDKKQKELRLFEEKFPEWKKEQKILAATKLLPNKYILFNNKSRLKKPLIQRKTVLIYSIISSAACIALFVMWRNQISENQIQIPPIAKNNHLKKNEKRKSHEDSLSVKETITILKKNLVSADENSIISKDFKEVITKDKKNQDPLIQLSENKTIQNQSDSIFENPNNTIFLKPESIENPTKTDELTYAALPEKSNEIEIRKFTLFSKLLAKYLNIHFGAGKKEKENSEEYYVYIGSFQVSRKISK